MPQTSRLTQTAALPFALLLAVGLTACSNSDGSSTPLTVVAEVEPNDDATMAGSITFARPVAGDASTAGDEDWWSVSLSAGDIIQVELFGARLDHASWDGAANTPQLKIFDTDGTTELLGHYPAGAPAPLPTEGNNWEWGWGDQDLDIPMFRAPASGTYYIRVSGADPLENGGEYALVVKRNNISGLQYEDETIAAPGSNDTFGTAEPITPGVLYGFHVDEEYDYFSFTIAEPTFVNFELVAHRNGIAASDSEYYDPELELYDTDGTSVLVSNDDTYFYDSSIQYWISTPGTYFVNVTECCGAGDAPYFLRYTRTLRGSATPEAEGNNATGSAQPFAAGDLIDADTITGDDDYYAIDALAGDVLFVRLFDSESRQDSAEDVALNILAPDGLTTAEYSISDKQVATFLVPADGTYYVYCSTGAATNADYAVEASLYRSNSFEAEPNGADVGANTFNNSGYAAGVIATNGDEDWFSFSAGANRLVTISAVGDSADYGYSNGFWNFASWGSQLAPKLEIVDTDGITVLATSFSDSQSHLSTESVIDAIPLVSVSFVAPAEGTYFVRVTSDDSTFGDDMFYALRKR